MAPLVWYACDERGSAVPEGFDATASAEAAKALETVAPPAAAEGGGMSKSEQKKV